MENVIRILKNEREFLTKIFDEKGIKQTISEIDQALQLLQTGVMRSNCIDESPEPRININKSDENDYYDGKFLK